MLEEGNAPETPAPVAAEVPSDLDSDLSSLAELYKEPKYEEDVPADDTPADDTPDTDTDAVEPEDDTNPDDADILKAFTGEPEQPAEPVPAAQAATPAMPELTPEQQAEIQEFEQWRQQKALAQQQAQRDAIPVPEILPEDFDNAFNDVDGMRNLLLKNNQTVVQAVAQMVDGYLQQQAAQHVLQNEYMVLLSLAGEKEPHLYEHPEALEAALRKHAAPGKDPRVVVTEAIAAYNRNYGVFKKMATSQKRKQFDVAPQGKPQSGTTRPRSAKPKDSDADPFGFGALFNAYRSRD